MNVAIVTPLENAVLRALATAEEARLTPAETVAIVAAAVRDSYGQSEEALRDAYRAGWRACREYVRQTFAVVLEVELETDAPPADPPQPNELGSASVGPVAEGVDDNQGAPKVQYDPRGDYLAASAKKLIPTPSLDDQGNAPSEWPSLPGAASPDAAADEAQNWHYHKKPGVGGAGHGHEGGRKAHEHDDLSGYEGEWWVPSARAVTIGDLLSAPDVTDAGAHS